eukprot:SAG11_NODE_27386_length_333_cov_0.876068_1_plen_110_part_11
MILSFDSHLTKPLANCAEQRDNNLTWFKLSELRLLLRASHARAHGSQSECDETQPLPILTRVDCNETHCQHMDWVARLVALIVRILACSAAAAAIATALVSAVAAETESV